MLGTAVRLQRELALEGFKDGRFEVLVCTDIAGRGADEGAGGRRAWQCSLDRIGPD